MNAVQNIISIRSITASMPFRQFSFSLLALLFLIYPLMAADSEVSGMRSFCISLLNSTGDLAPKVCVPEVASSESQDIINHSHSLQYTNALEALVQANASVEKLRAAGFSYQRSMDIYMSALQWFDGQSSLELSGAQGSFTFVFDKVREIKAIERLAFLANDELSVLSQRLNAVDSDVYLSDALSLEADAKREFADGRFEESQRIAQQAYESVSRAESETAHSKTLLESTRQTIENFLLENWKTIVSIVLVAALLAFIFQKHIRRHMAESKLRSLAGERAVLETMIQSLQADYFQRGKINELSYNIKTKKYGDLIRDINRQLPLLKEELKKI